MKNFILAVLILLSVGAVILRAQVATPTRTTTPTPDETREKEVDEMKSTLRAMLKAIDASGMAQPTRIPTVRP